MLVLMTLLTKRHLPTSTQSHPSYYDILGLLKITSAFLNLLRHRYIVTCTKEKEDICLQWFIQLYLRSVG